MPEEKHTFGKPTWKMPDDLPDYLPREKTVTSVLKGATIDDYVWLGVHGELDPDALAKEYLGPSILLRSVLLAIVEANPVSGEATEKRVRTAMKALIGETPKMGRPSASENDELLAHMIDSYARGFYGFGPTANSLNALAEEALQQSDPEYSAMDDESRASRRRTLRERFEDEKDRLLSMKMAEEEALRSASAKIAAAIHAIERLGIDVSKPRTEPPRAILRRLERVTDVKGRKSETSNSRGPAK